MHRKNNSSELLAVAPVNHHEIKLIRAALLEVCQGEDILDNVLLELDTLLPPVYSYMAVVGIGRFAQRFAKSNGLEFMPVMDSRVSQADLDQAVAYAHGYRNSQTQTTH